MGSGKTIVGKELSSVLSMSFMDLDAIIESKENKTISEIFSKKGEIYFRKKEHEYLKELIHDDEDLVLSLGGGTPCYASNMELLLSSPNVKSIYLKCSISVLAQRLFEERSTRPLIAHIDSQEELSEFIGKHLFERHPFYEKADLTIDTSDLSIRDVIEIIILNLF